MHRRLSVLVVLAMAAGCDRKSDVAPLDHDASMLRPDTAVAAVPSTRVDELLDEARGAVTTGDTATAEGSLAGAVTVADTDAALVARIADRSLALGLAAYAELGYRRYLALAPRGPLAEQARQRLALLAPETVAAAPRAVPVPATAVSHEVKRATVRAVRRTPALGTAARGMPARGMPARGTPARVTRVASAPARRVPPAPTVSAGETARVDGVSTTAAPAARADGASAPTTTVASAAPDTTTTTTASPAPTRRRSSAGKGAVLGAASGAVLGAVIGGGARGGIMGAVAGSVLGAAVGGHSQR
ncbi:hypothetical protein J421_2421 [Gemmatirosa kalamazoonensis]|uniref:Glycine zipper domain-containing protein n=1 Tax=Gemmatirosa kalamazoonensis TaxID=861299 RepID=W0RKJ7_9BACT|nr:hypothetical protein [Gemmatirosa kalamazoonensis]AHG89958.1 hypothetical protein J421_2421 [Gemmatirosa kalamazoonensis]